MREPEDAVVFAPPPSTDMAFRRRLVCRRYVPCGERKRTTATVLLVINSRVVCSGGVDVGSDTGECFLHQVDVVAYFVVAVGAPQGQHVNHQVV